MGFIFLPQIDDRHCIYHYSHIFNQLRSFKTTIFYFPGNDLLATLQGAGQKMFHLSQILAEKEEQLQKLRNEKESESVSKSHQVEEIARKIPGLLGLST